MPSVVRADFRTRDSEAAGRMRALLLALVVLGTVGLILELVLLEHMESLLQWIPLGVLAIGLAASAVLAVKQTARTVRAFQLAMAAFVATALVGLVLHYRGNVAFELEMDSSIAGIDLIWRSLRGATPALAPGAMAQVGLLGLIQSYGHPALRR